MIVRKTNMTTLIISRDREFKVRSVNFLNNIAFQSEKFTISSIDEAKPMLDQNPTLLNVVIDGHIILNQKEWATIESLSSKDHVMILVYTKEADYQTYKTSKSNIMIRPLPFVKSHFVESFHQRNESPASLKQKQEEAHKPKIQSQKSQTVEEATKHLLQTIDQINALANDLSQIQALLNIGQRFNGVIGAFSFLENKIGMKELKRLALVIDSVAKTYESKKIKSIEKNHHHLVLQAAKCSYKILLQLRDNPTALSHDLIREEEKLFHDFDVDQDLYKRANHSQKDIDDLLQKIS